MERVYGTGQFSGVGYVLGDHGDIHLGGADFDGCLDAATHRTLPGRQEHVRVAKELGGWAELSPSGTGLHVITVEDQRYSAKTTKGVEVYSDGRFFTYTGEPVPGFTAVDDVPPASLHAARMLAGAHDTDRDDDRPAPMPKAGIGIDLPAALELLDHLPILWLDDYHSWLRTGMALHHEFGGEEEALWLWDEWSMRSPKFQDGMCAVKWETFGKPGKDEVTMRTLVREAESTGWRAPATIARAVLDFSPRDWLDGARARRFDLTALPPVHWLFDGVARCGKVTVLAGAGGSSKSFFALTLAAHWVAGKAFDVFLPVHREPNEEVLLVFAEEDEDDLHHRFAATMRIAAFNPEQRAEIDERLLLTSLLEMSVDAALAEYEPSSRRMRPGPLMDLLRATLAQRPQLRWLVMDPLVLLHSLEENDNGAMGGLFKMLGKLAREFHVAIWLVHHLSKTGAQADDLNAQHVRGASAIVDNTRAVLVMQRLAAQDAAALGASAQDAQQMVRLSFAKNNHGRPRSDHYFRIDDESGAVQLLPAQPMSVPTGARKAMRKLAQSDQLHDFKRRTCERALLELLDSKPLGSRAIYDMRPGGCSRTVTERVLHGLVEDGLVISEPAARGSKLHRLSNAGRERMAELGSAPDDLLL